jgi:DNA-directed RNA polymerase specialized sigma24 family protein
MGTQSAETAEAKEVLASLDGSEREALRRYYAREQRPDQICVDLGFTECGFSSLKSRVRAKYFELMRGQLTRRQLT